MTKYQPAHAIQPQSPCHIIIRFNGFHSIQCFISTRQPLRILIKTYNSAFEVDYSLLGGLLECYDLLPPPVDYAIIITYVFIKESSGLVGVRAHACYISSYLKEFVKRALFYSKYFPLLAYTNLEKTRILLFRYLQNNKITSIPAELFQNAPNLLRL